MLPAGHYEVTSDSTGAILKIHNTGSKQAVEVLFRPVRQATPCGQSKLVFATNMGRQMLHGFAELVTITHLTCPMQPMLIIRLFRNEKSMNCGQTEGFPGLPFPEISSCHNGQTPAQVRVRFGRVIRSVPVRYATRVDNARMTHDFSDLAQRTDRPRLLREAVECLPRVRPISCGIAHAHLSDATGSTACDATAKSNSAWCRQETGARILVWNST